MQNGNIEFFSIRNNYHDQIINPLLAVLLEHVVFSMFFFLLMTLYFTGNYLKRQVLL